jgi:chaperone modulatory protein CbpM
VIHHVHAGVLGVLPDAPALPRRRPATRAPAVTHGAARPADGFDADEQLAALVVDMTDEIRRLRARLHALGFD